MNATILHESRGRIRLQLRQKQMTLAQADLLEAWIQGKSWCRQVTVHERTCCVILYYDGTRQAVLNEIRHFSWQEAERTTALPAHSSRALNREFEEKLVAKVVCKAACTLFLPSPLRIARILWHMIPFVRRGLRCLLRRRIKVELLDALSISISACRRDFGTAGMVMFLLEVGELLEEWTRKKSVADLARCMSLNVDRVWLRTAQGEVLVPVSQIQPGDAVVVRAGGIIPVDGLVLEGEVTVNQASLTGESIPVPKRPGGAVYAGTVVEEGECVLEVKQASGQSRYDQIVHMIEQSEQMKSEAESKAANLADKLVPYTFAGSLLSFALTRNVTRALSVLMVDFSCALKLAMPLAVLSAMREAGKSHITVKGGKFLEAVAAADTIVFDKTGTLTRGTPGVAHVHSALPELAPQQLHLLTAAAERRSEHPLGKAIVRDAGTRDIPEAEDFRMLPGRGVSARVDGHALLAGNAALLQDNGIALSPTDKEEAQRALDAGQSLVYVALDGRFAGFIALADSLRNTAAATLQGLRDAGVSTMLLTGDNEAAAHSVSAGLALDGVRANCLPADKLEWIADSQRQERPVCMIGDGINDAPALKKAFVGVAMGGIGSDIAVDAADMALVHDDIKELPHIFALSRRMMRTITLNLSFSMILNFAAIFLAMGGLLSPVLGALVHNAGSVLVIINSALLLNWRHKEAGR